MSQGNVVAVDPVLGHESRRGSSSIRTVYVPYLTCLRQAGRHEQGGGPGEPQGCRGVPSRNRGEVKASHGRHISKLIHRLVLYSRQGKLGGATCKLMLSILPISIVLSLASMHSGDASHAQALGTRLPAALGTLKQVFFFKGLVWKPFCGRCRHSVQT